MVSFDGVIGVLLGDVARGGHQFIEHARVGRCPIRGHLARWQAMFEGLGEEPASGCQVSLRRHQDIDDLAVLVDRPVQADPSSSDLDILLIREPSIPRSVSAGSCRVDQQRGESLHPSINRDVINSNAPLDEQFFDVAVDNP